MREKREGPRIIQFTRAIRASDVHKFYGDQMCVYVCVHICITCIYATSWWWYTTHALVHNKNPYTKSTHAKSIAIRGWMVPLSRVCIARGGLVAKLALRNCLASWGGEYREAIERKRDEITRWLWTWLESSKSFVCLCDFLSFFYTRIHTFFFFFSSILFLPFFFTLSLLFKPLLRLLPHAATTTHSCQFFCLRFILDAFVNLSSVLPPFFFFFSLPHIFFPACVRLQWKKKVIHMFENV